jgi:hypothetical protein
LLRHPGFAHKTGNTENYASDAGRLRLGDGRLLFVAMTSSLGARYAQGDPSGFPPAPAAARRSPAALVRRLVSSRCPTIHALRHDGTGRSG